MRGASGVSESVQTTSACSSSSNSGNSVLEREGSLLSDASRPTMDSNNTSVPLLRVLLALQFHHHTNPTRSHTTHPPAQRYTHEVVVLTPTEISGTIITRQARIRHRIGEPRQDDSSVVSTAGILSHRRRKGRGNPSHHVKCTEERHESVPSPSQNASLTCTCITVCHLVSVVPSTRVLYAALGWCPCPAAGVLRWQSQKKWAVHAQCNTREATHACVSAAVALFWQSPAPSCFASNSTCQNAINAPIHTKFSTRQ